MDLCSWNGELALKFIPLCTLVAPLVALWIFRQWNNQKEKETSSNLAINIYEYIEDVKFSVVKTENILFHLIRNNNASYTREKQKEVISEISFDFNKSISKLISYLKIIKANSTKEVIEKTLIDLTESVEKINRLTLNVDSKYWSKGHLTLDEENKYVGDLNQNIKRINDAINNEELEKILQKLAMYREDKSA
ncbi:hypothetical protein [Acinetobacter sp. ANC 3832]|uniref:hypothetical protein n=1 Tax=Acinetobacter sp. ANC 3832 TaxID=1977874 RepID=UPI000A337541|nr:hypothetical protein [Acinetobacter sp. ANC 3832]OTG86312.1 hypothetical protein B9T35_18050 [Acinetobacter sp. ANC 3832]